MRTFWHDLRFGLRMLKRNPAFTTAALLALGLGIGATSSIVTVVNAVLLSSLPYPDPDRLVFVNSTLRQEAGVQEVPVSYLDFSDWQEKSQAFESLALYFNQSFNLLSGGEPEHVRGEMVSAEYFRMLGVEPSLGRIFSREEDTVAGTRPLVILSHELWQRRFGGRRVLGDTVALNGESYEIVGVMPAGFGGLTDRAELWIPVVLAPRLMPKQILEARGFRWFSAVGRLAEGTSLEQAQASLETLAQNLEEEYADTNRDIGVRVKPLGETWVGSLRPALLTLLGAAGFVLLIACTSVAILLVARAAGRQREVSLRAALGAARGRILRQLLTESLLLALLGGAIGLILSRWSTGILVAASSVDFRSFMQIALDFRVLGAVLAVSALCAIGFGLVPAWLTSHSDLAQALREGSKGSAGAGRHRLQGALVVFQIAVAIVLLTGSGLMIQGFEKFRATDLGFETAELLTLRIDLKGVKYGNYYAKFDAAHAVLDRLEPLPMIEAIEIAGPGIPTDDWNGGFFQVERTPDDVAENVVLLFHHVTPGFFSILGIPLLQGRDFNAADVFESEPVVIISKAMADRFWPGVDPIGKRLQGPYPSFPWFKVVGVVADVRHGGLSSNEQTAPDIYLALFQRPPNTPPLLNLLVRPKAPPAMALAATLRQEMIAIAPDLPLYDVMTMEQRLDDQTAKDRFLVLLMSLFALLALVLATVGIYGVIAYTVTERTREIGIRMALGAERGDVLRMVVGRGLRLALIGVVIGTLAAVALSQIFERFLYGVKADGLTLAGTVLLLVVVTLLACWVPARRAMRIEPVATLRAE